MKTQRPLIHHRHLRAFFSQVLFRKMEARNTAAAVSNWPALSRAWYARCDALAALEPQPDWLSPVYLTAMRRCRPVGYPASRACRRGLICPYCWARNALTVWNRLDGLIYPDGYASPAPLADYAVRPGHAYDVVLREIGLLLPPGRDGKSPHELFVENYVAATANNKRIFPRRTDTRHLTEAGAVGGIESVRFAPESRPAGNWAQCVRISQLILVEPTKVKSFLADPHLPVWARDTDSMRVIGAKVRVKHVAAPSRLLLARLAGSVLRYPLGLLVGPLPLAIEAVTARTGRRLVITFGRLHGGSQR